LTAWRVILSEPGDPLEGIKVESYLVTKEQFSCFYISSFDLDLDLDQIRFHSKGWFSPTSIGKGRLGGFLMGFHSIF
jgi:hypothetical protein